MGSMRNAWISLVPTPDKYLYFSAERNYHLIYTALCYDVFLNTFTALGSQAPWIYFIHFSL